MTFKRKISTIVQWIDNGTLLEGNEPLPSNAEQSDFFREIRIALMDLGWKPDTVSGKPFYEECVFNKEGMRYRFSLESGRSYKFRREDQSFKA
jgi:hypothetical protein